MRVCFIGAGSIGKRHIRNLSEVCKNREISLEITLLRATQRPLPDDIIKLVDNTIHSFEELSGKYDAIFITNPTYLHYETIKKTLVYTDCFFIEKPVFDNTSYDLSFLDVGKRFYVACPLRYTSVLLEAKKVIDAEKVLSVRAISSSYLPDWRPGQDYRETYSAHKDQGGGVRIDLIHEWDYLLSFFGTPKKIYSFSGKYSDLEIDSEDIATYIAQYNDKIIELHLDYFGRYTRRSVEVRTMKHEYIFDIANATVSIDGCIVKKFDETPNDKYMREMEYFLELVQGKKKSTNTIEMAVKSIQIAEGTNEK